MCVRVRACSRARASVYDYERVYVRTLLCVGAIRAGEGDTTMNIFTRNINEPALGIWRGQVCFPSERELTFHQES